MDTARSSWLTPTVARAYRAVRRSKDRGDFSLFQFLPQEVQILILKYAFPPKRLIRLAFNTTLENFCLTLNLQVLPDLHITRLLETCEFFKQEVLREFKKVEINKYTRGSRTKMFAAMENPRPPNYFWDCSRRNNFGTKGMGYRSLSHVYLQPDLDTLIVSYQELFTLYLAGGSIDLSSVKHLALITHGTHAWGWGRGLNALTGLDVQHLMLGMISVECPALEKLSIVLAPETFMTQAWTDTAMFIFDVTDDFIYLDFMDGNRKLLQLLPDILPMMVADILLDFEEFPRHENAEYQLKSESIRFWKKRAPIPGVIAALILDEDWREEGRSYAEPFLWFPTINAYLPAHADGTVLDKYKGLAQIFDGAPW